MQQPEPDLDRVSTSPDARNDGHAESVRLQDRAETVDPSVVDYLRVLYRRRWTAATLFVLVVGFAALQVFTATPLYEARVRLLIEADTQNVVTFQQVVDEEQHRPDYYQTQHNILQSRALARRTLDSLELWNTPPFIAGDETFSLFQTLLRLPAVGASALVGLVRSDPDISENSIPGADETSAQSNAIDRFLSNLNVAPIRNSRLVDIRYTLPDPRLATRIANEMAKNYIQQNLEYRFMASQEATDWLGERLSEQRAQVEQAELALQRYREQNDAISMEDSENIVVQKLADLNAAVTRAKTVRIEKEALYNQLRASQANPAALDTFPAILANGFIQQQKTELARLQQEQAQLTERLGDKHPDMQRVRAAIQISQAKLDGEIAKVVQSVRSEYRSAAAQEESLATALNQQKSEAMAMNRKAIDYNVLQREADSSKQIYQSLMQRAKETGVAGELRTSNIRVVDEAEPPRAPFTPRPFRTLLLASVVGLLLAVAVVFSVDYLDSRISDPEEIKSYLGLPYLGLLPMLEAKALTNGYPLLAKGVPAIFAEAIRAVRTNVLFAAAQDGPRTLAVTSTGPGEGKSLVASNLAVAFAQAGQRVLLLDGDMRKPKVHEVFGLAQEPGLSNVLVGNAKASEAVHKSDVSGLWLLTAGRIPPNPAELLGSDRFRDFLHSVSQHFDSVIIDLPPVMAVTDAALVANRASGVLFVVGADKTSRHTARQALDQLDNAHARFVGAVLNGADLNKNRYYYTAYYRREYSTYYAQAGR